MFTENMNEDIIFLTMLLMLLSIRSVGVMQKDNPFNEEVEEYEEWFKTNDKLLCSELFKYL